MTAPTLSITAHKRWSYPLHVCMAHLLCMFDSSDANIEAQAELVITRGVDIRVDGKSIRITTAGGKR